MREWENIFRMSLFCSIFFLPFLCCCFLLYVIAFLCASLLSFAVVYAAIKICSCWVNGQKGWPFSGVMMKRRELSLFLGWGRVSLSGFSVAVVLEARSGRGGRLLLSCVAKKCEKKCGIFLCYGFSLRVKKKARFFCVLGFSSCGLWRYGCLSNRINCKNRKNRT